MSITNIIIVLTFISALIDRLSKKSDFKSKLKLRFLDFDYVTLGLLLMLVVFQLLDKKNEGDKETRKENQSTETYKKVITSHDKLDTVNLRLENILKDISVAIQFTKREFSVIDSLNYDIQIVRTSIEKNLDEYKNLNAHYEEQLKIEQEKILEAKPDLRIVNPVSIIDSTNFAFQFTFINNGKRIADSIKYYSAMIFVDSTLHFAKLDLIKTNYSEYNVLSIPGDAENLFFVNSNTLNKNNVKKYFVGLLLIKYTFKDNMSGIKQKPELKIFKCTSFDKGNIQFGQNIDSKDVSSLKQFLYQTNRICYDMFFE
jgi:hypothetical protein